MLQMGKSEGKYFFVNFCQLRKNYFLEHLEIFDDGFILNYLSFDI